jgi:dihydrofolate synthase/folylpolyglutamate synthase
LDAVNAFEPDCAIVTSVDLDHMEFLGDTREKIGFEKAGVYRKAIPAICGDNNPPTSLVGHAKQIQADLMCVHQDFGYHVVEDGWQYQLHGKLLHTLPMPALKGDYQLNNAACAVTAVESLQAKLPVSSQAIAEAMQQATLAGRFQTVAHSPQVILDVAHNPHAARALAENLKNINSPQANTIAVFAMLADKDIKGVVEAVKEQIDIWYIATIDNVRGASATDLAAVIAVVKPDAKCKIFENAAIAYQQACIDAGENDKIVVFGSFFTVSNVMQALSDHSKN